MSDEPRKSATTNDYRNRATGVNRRARALMGAALVPLRNDTSAVRKRSDLLPRGQSVLAGGAAA